MTTPAASRQFDDRARWDREYLGGTVPWDTGITPPEVRLFWNSRLVEPSGTALDLGCGTGTNVAFLAALGLRVIGFDLSSVALVQARERVSYRAPQRDSCPFLIQADVSSLPIHALGARYILDIGCLHSVPRERRAAYATGVSANLAAGGFYHLFAHDALRCSGEPDQTGRGVGETEVADLFSPQLSLSTVHRGQPDPRPCRWYLFHKPL